MINQYITAGLQWKLDGHPCYESEIVKAGGKNAELFLEGYHDFGKYSMEKKDATVSPAAD